jgi:large subunit ribosomal protein L3
MSGIIGKKIGMTSVFVEDGSQVPVTVVQAGPCVVVQRKTESTDQYSAIQIGFEDQKEQRLTKAQQGHYKKAKAGPRKVLREFRVGNDDEVKVGDEITVADFAEINFVDVTGTSKGQGFQGAVKRHNFGGGRKTHGGHMHRGTGSIGQCVSPARVMKGRKMPGHMGHKKVTTQNLKVIQIDTEENLLLIEGAIPGPNGGYVTVKKSIKKA